MSDLRTRIAAVITEGVINGRGHGDIADAVIAALGLQPEYGHLDETDSGAIADTIQELGEPCPGETLRHRYITPWKDINETD